MKRLTPTRRIWSAMLVAVTLVSSLVVVGAAAPASAATPPDPVVVPPTGQAFCYPPFLPEPPCMGLPSGGSVMSDVKAHLIFWLPEGYSFAPGVPDGNARHMELVQRLFDDLSGSETYNILAQYYATRVGSAPTYYPNRITADAYVETRPFPQAPLMSPDIEAEITLASEAAGWSPQAADFLHDIYFVFTPVGVQTCLLPRGGCSGTHFEAYHSDYRLPFDGSTSDCVEYDPDQCALVNHVYVPTLGAGADLPYPNNAFVDPVLSVTWHELAESVTNPYRSGWESAAVQFVTDRFREVGDLCNPTFLPDGHGPRGADGANVELNGNRYLLQRIYSNAANGCTHAFHGQFVNFAQPAAQTTASPPFSLTADATSTLPVTFEAAGPCTVSGATVTVTGVGSCTITASQPGDRPAGGFYHPATPVVRTFAIADGLPATAAPTVSPAPSSTGWNRTTPVTVTWNWTDASSGLAPTCAPSTSVSTEGVTTVDASCDDAVGNHGTAQQVVKIDSLAPSATITAPTAGTRVPVGAALTASYSCADSGSGAASCQARLADGTPIANGASLPTAVAGARRIDVTATDVAGNTATVSVDYEVVAAPPPVSASDLLRRQVALVQSFHLSPARSLGLLAPLAVAQLGVALRLKPLACQSMAVFDRTVNTYLSSRWLTNAQAAQLRSGSTAIRSAIPC